MAGRKRKVKPINLALQGGGSHGAFTWGVLDRLFEDDRLDIAAISGTSAGAMNAVVAAHGYHDGGAEGARAKLDSFWRAVSAAAMASPIRRSPLDILTGTWNLDLSPAFTFFDMLSRVASPYELNPLRLNPLRDVIEDQIDFAKVRDCEGMGLFLAATRVHTGRVRVFRRSEITADVMMASACLPFLFHAVEIEGEPYWDGGYMGNPPLFPFFSGSDCDDIVIVQTNPIVREGTPASAREILNRLNEITFNSALQHELRAIRFVTRLIDEGDLDAKRYRRMMVHMIHGRKQIRPLGASSKLNAEWPFLRHLFEIGRAAAEDWLARNFAALGQRSTIDIEDVIADHDRRHAEAEPLPDAAE